MDIGCDFRIAFQSFPVGAKDHEIQYDGEEEYNRKLVNVLNQSVNKFIENFNNNPPEKVHQTSGISPHAPQAYESMCRGFRRLVSIEDFKAMVEGGTLILF